MLCYPMADLTRWRLRTAGRLVRGAAHDIRNPVGILHGNAAFLAQVAAAHELRVKRLEEACGPYASAQELREAALAIIEEGKLDREETATALDECGIAIERQLLSIEAIARIGRDTEDDQAAPHALDAVVEEGVTSARLFGQHIAQVSVDVPPIKVDTRRSVAVLLVCVVVLDALERYGRSTRLDPVTVRYEEGELIVADQAPAGPEPEALAPICEALGTSYTHAPNEVRVRL